MFGGINLLVSTITIHNQHCHWNETMAQEINTNAMEVDEGGYAAARDTCPHILESVSMPDTLDTFPDLAESTECEVDKCSHSESWLCMKCHKILCGRYGQQHMIEHKNNSKHYIAMSCADLSFWCYQCDDYLNHLRLRRIFEFYKIAHVKKFKHQIHNLEKESTDFQQQDNLEKQMTGKKTNVRGFRSTASRNKDRRERKEIYHKKISKKKTNNIQIAKAIINKKKDIKLSKNGAIDKRSKLYKALKKNKKHTTSKCSYKRIAAAILAKEFGHIPSEAFDSAVDRCYCLKCHNKRGDRLIYKRGNPSKQYALPIGWVRFGLQTNDVICKMSNVWDEWHVAYHGTMKETVSKIFAGGLLLLKPGDVAIGGHTVGVRGGHIPKPLKRRNLYTGTDEMFDPNQIYLSPSIKYAGNEYYAKTSVCGHPLKRDKRLKVKFAFQVRVRAESYHIGQETIEAKGVIDEYFDNNELEWYTKETAGIVVYGLLIKFEKKHKSNFIDLT